MIFRLCFHSALPLNLLLLKNRAADRGVKQHSIGSLSGCSASPRYAIAGSQEHPSPARHLRPGQSVHRASASIALPRGVMFPQSGRSTLQTPLYGPPPPHFPVLCPVAKSPCIPSLAQPFIQTFP